MSFVVPNATVALELQEIEYTVGKDAAKIIEKGKVIETFIDKDNFGPFNKYTAYVIYKGIFHRCRIVLSASVTKGKTSRVRCEELLDIEWED